MDNDTPTDDAYALAVVEEMHRSRTLVPPRLRNSFTARYVVALVLIASLTLGIGWSATHRISVQGTDAAVVNVAGRQRMLSQRIALMAGLYDAAATDGRQADAARLGALLEVDATDMRTAQIDLLEGNADRNLPGGPSPTLRALYADGTARGVEEHTADALALLEATTPGDRREFVTSVQQRATGALLGDLDQIVRAYQQEAEDRVERMLRIEEIVISLMLTVLLLEALLVFRPMSRRIRRETARLEAAAARHQAEASRHAFGLRLRDAVDLADTEGELIEVVGQAVTASGMEGRVDLLLTDPTETGTLLPVLARTEQTCSVRDAESCPALRRGRTMRFSEPDGLGGCGHFRHDARRAGRADLACTCVPMTFLGGAVGVLRAVAEDGVPGSDDDVEQYEHIARATGTHLGTLRAFAHTRAAAERDPLTGLLNRRGLDGELAALARARRDHLVLALDLDHFKRVNDLHGHAVGDAVLVATAATLVEVCRPGDLVARTGGEEFVIVAPCAADPDLARADGLGMAERIRAVLEDRTREGTVPSCTTSIGLAGPTITEFDATLARADAALYRAKETGRNRVVVDGDASTEDVAQHAPTAARPGVTESTAADPTGAEPTTAGPAGA